MPNIIQGNTTYRDSAEIGKRMNFNYEYPENLDLKPGSKLHEAIKDKVLQNARESANVMTNRFESWREMDRILTTYIELSGDEEDIKYYDKRKPVSIVFPYTYAILESILSYLVAAFFQDPMFRYEGIGPEDTIGAILLEKVIDYQVYKQKMALNLHTMFRDSMTYGLGITAPVWTEKHGYKTVAREQIVDPGFFGYGEKMELVKDREETLLYEGNKLINIDPYLYLPDPNVAVHEVQDGEFVGWVDQTNLMTALTDEKTGALFNIKYLKGMNEPTTSIYDSSSSGRDDKAGTGTKPRTKGVTNPLDIIYQYATVIPKDMGLGKSEYPEKWLFALAGDNIVVNVQRLGLDHDLYPLAVTSPDFDGYSANPISRMEVIYGLQGTLDWLFNSHVANVRKAINDMFVVDPYLLNMRDIQDPEAGKLIRTRRPAWGKGVDGVIKQLAVSDITRGNVADSQLIVDMMQKVAGADNPIMGNMRQGGPERLTSAEFQGTAQGAVNRLERVARVIGLQGMQDIGYLMASQTQQLMSEEMKINTTGRWAEKLIAEYGDNSAVASPYDILVDYDVKVRDGSIPGGNYSEIWLKMFEVVATQPELANKFDIVRIFKHIARNSGAKNVDEFEKVTQVKTIPDEAVDSELQQGNILPFEQMTGVI
jgi:hypothetical protein